METVGFRFVLVVVLVLDFTGVFEDEDENENDEAVRIATGCAVGVEERTPFDRAYAALEWVQSDCGYAGFQQPTDMPIAKRTNWMHSRVKQPPQPVHVPGTGKGEEMVLEKGREPGCGGKLIPRDVSWLSEFELNDAQWDALALPIGLAFFFRSTPAGRVVAMYPSAAGATESLLSLETWQGLAVDNPVLADMEPDVQALLVNRLGPAPLYFIVPIDLCYELAGLVRVRWRGLSGGDSVWQETRAFFARLTEAAVAPKEAVQA